MAVRISFLSCFAPEKAKDACKIMSLEEHGVKYVMEFNPPVDCVAYTVDGNIIKGTGTDKCDKLVFAKSVKRLVSIFVELKGSDVAHAVKQLEATINHLLFSKNRTDRIVARIVSRKMPANAGNSVVVKAKKRFRVKYNCELLCIKSNNPDRFKSI